MTLKYLGPTGNNLTKDKVYTVVGVGCDASPISAVIVNDKKELQRTCHIDDLTKWKLDSA